MKRTLSILLMVIAIFPLISAINLDVKKLNSENVLVKGLPSNLKVNLSVTNLEKDANFRFYNLIGFEISPSDWFFLRKGETKNIELTIVPRTDLKYSKKFVFNFYIIQDDKTEQKEQILFRVLSIGEALEINPIDITPNSENLTLIVRNTLDLSLENITIKINSLLSNDELSFSLAPHEEKSLSLSLDKDALKGLEAGFYTLSIELETNGIKDSIEKRINYLETDLISTSEERSGFIINTHTIKKENIGNTPMASEIKIQKNILSRLFTSFNVEPDLAKREGFRVFYFWNRELSPGEVLTVRATTNWIIPIIVVLLIVSIVVMAKRYSRDNLLLKKRISFVKAKGGEFALKVTITVKARKNLERVNIIDRLPAIVKIYERFGSEKPSSIDEKHKKIQWEFERLEQGEVRALSYIIYSKVGVLGKFVLPSAVGVYEVDGKIAESKSNRAFFVADQGIKEED